jgi:hypothetical protein
LHTYISIPLDTQFQQQKCRDLPSNNPKKFFGQIFEAAAALNHLLQATDMYLTPRKVIEMGLLCCQGS